MKAGHNDENKIYAKHLKQDGFYICKLCEAKYKHSRDLKKHIMKKHYNEEELKEEYKYSALANKRQCREMVIAPGTVTQQKGLKNTLFKDIKVTK